MSYNEKLEEEKSHRDRVCPESANIDLKKREFFDEYMREVDRIRYGQIFLQPKIIL